MDGESVDGKEYVTAFERVAQWESAEVVKLVV